MKYKQYSGVLIRFEDKVLLCKRNAYESLPGEWSVPCGHQEPNEDKLTCAVRELYEETMIEVSPSDLSYIGGIKRYNRDTTKLKGVMSVFLYDVDEEILPDLDNAKDGHEHTQCNYYGIDELPTPIGEQLKKLIEIVLR
jgi:8-oxo-dGTP pyrophosphatase MutT (NUDIX family)